MKLDTLSSDTIEYLHDLSREASSGLARETYRTTALLMESIPEPNRTVVSAAFLINQCGLAVAFLDEIEDSDVLRQAIEKIGAIA